MKQKEALLIIDMQPGFPSSHKHETVQGCQSLIKTFKRKNLPIYVLEYEAGNNGKTHERISSLYANYPHVKTYKKRMDDGSFVLHKHIKHQIDHFTVCGVNTTACVMDTVYGLLAKGYSATVVKKACNGGSFKEFHKISMWEFREDLVAKLKIV
jgi:nicotinamidase-related amidase